MKLDFYTKRNQLDEMQEQKLCKMESRGFWLLWWGLLIVMAIQSLMGMQAQVLAGEWILFMAASLYLVIGCIRNGIWDRHFKANPTANLAGSVVAGIAIFLFTLARSGGYWPGALLAGVFTLLLCFAVLQFTTWLYKQRHNQLENIEEDNDEQQNRNQ